MVERSVFYGTPDGNSTATFLTPYSESREKTGSDGHKISEPKICS